MSLYTARFLESDDTGRQRLFGEVKELYKQRSKAVHGREIKGDANECVKTSAALLHRLVRHCVTRNGLPNVEALAP